MMRMLIYLLLAVLASACAATPPSPPLPEEGEWSNHYKAGLTAWYGRIEGKVRADGDNYGSWMDLHNDIGLDRRTWLYMVNAQVYVHPDWFISADFVNFDERGTATTKQGEAFNGMYIPWHSEIRSKVRMTNLAVDAGWKLYDWRGVSYGLTGGLVGSEQSYDLAYQTLPSEPYSQDTTSLDWLYLFPTVGGFGGYMSRMGLGVSARAKGMWYMVGNYIARYYDLEGQLDYKLNDNIVLYLGYRQTYYEGGKKDLHWKYNFWGPYTGFYIRF